METPKEKAEQLVGNMFTFIPMRESVELTLLTAKYCAIQAVLEIINVLGDGGVYGWADPAVEEYWQEVLKELRNFKKEN